MRLNEDVLQETCKILQVNRWLYHAKHVAPLYLIEIVAYKRFMYELVVG